MTAYIGGADVAFTDPRENLTLAAYLILDRHSPAASFEFMDGVLVLEDDEDTAWPSNLFSSC